MRCRINKILSTPQPSIQAVSLPFFSTDRGTLICGVAYRFLPTLSPSLSEDSNAVFRQWARALWEFVCPKIIRDE
jgi:hypothetical protein